MDDGIKITTEKLCFAYQDKKILQDIDLALPAGSLVAVTGASGLGKTTFLLVFNRLWQELGGGTCRGRVTIRFADGPVDIYGKEMSVTLLRRRVGMVFQVPNPLPMSVYKNVAFPLLLQGGQSPDRLAAQVEKMLKKVHLFEEVKDRLNSDARLLSGGQQQRLCLARALMSEPEILLLDEPTSSLDSAASARIEELLVELRGQCTFIMVSHYRDQIRRVADHLFELADRQLFRIW